MRVYDVKILHKLYIIGTVHGQGYWDNGLGKIREALGVSVWRCQAACKLVQQAAVNVVCCLITSARMMDDRPTSEVDFGGGEIVDALVVATVVVIGDEGFDVDFDNTREVVVSGRIRFSSV